MTTIEHADRLLEGSSGKRWRVRAIPDLRAFEDAPWPRLLSLLLALRDVHDTAAGKAYLGAPGELTTPALMPTLDIAVARLARACRAHERVAVFGDFAVDGVPSTPTLTEGLPALGAEP